MNNHLLFTALGLVWLLSPVALIDLHSNETEAHAYTDYRDMGEVVHGIGVPLDFHLTNPFPGDAALVSLSTSCPCLSWKEPEDILFSVNQTRPLSVVFQGKQIGNYDSTITAEWTDTTGEIRYQRYRVTAENVDYPRDAIVRTGHLLSEPNRYAVWDLRSPEEFQQAHIPGSSSVALRQLPLEIRRETKDIVLVSQGHPDTLALQAYSTLRSMGRSVHLLDGGILRWRAQGHPLRGTAPDSLSLLFTSLDKLFAEQPRNPHIWLAPGAEGSDLGSLPEGFTWETGFPTIAESAGDGPCFPQSDQPMRPGFIVFPDTGSAFVWLDLHRPYAECAATQLVIADSGSLSRYYVQRQRQHTSGKSDHVLLSSDHMNSSGTLHRHSSSGCGSCP